MSKNVTAKCARDEGEHVAVHVRAREVIDDEMNNTEKAILTEAPPAALTEWTTWLDGRIAKPKNVQ